MAISKLVERAVHSRVVRVSFATTLIASSIWAFGPHLSSRVSSSAFVNSEILRVSSPIAGRLTQNLPARGSFIAESNPVDLVEVLAPDQRHLFELREQSAIAQRRADLASRQLREIESSDRELGGRSTAYQSGMVQRIANEILEAKAESKGCQAEAEQRRDVGSRMEELVKLGTASQIRSVEAHANQQAITTRCDMAEARVQRLAAELESAQRGIFLRDGANDAPYSRQQRDRLMLRRQELETELLNQTAKAEQLSNALKEEEERLARANGFELVLPAGYVVWSTAASPGSTVVEGQAVIDLADCRRRFVAVELPEREFEQIKVGDRASVRLVGGNTWVDGRVRYARGSAALTDDRLLAARVAKPSSGSLTVEVELPAEVWAEDRSRNFCDIGRLAEVRFPRGSGLPGLMRRLTGTAIAATK
jgi:multidrug resistance efflux pump